MGKLTLDSLVNKLVNDGVHAMVEKLDFDDEVYARKVLIDKIASLHLYKYVCHDYCKDDSPCKGVLAKGSIYCGYHKKIREGGECQQYNTDGSPCKKLAREDGYCHVHTKSKCLCKGTNANHRPCKNIGLYNGYCSHHCIDKKDQCQAVTKKKTQCTRKATIDGCHGVYCTIHNPYGDEEDIEKSNTIDSINSGNKCIDKDKTETYVTTNSRLQAFWDELEKPVENEN